MNWSGHWGVGPEQVEDASPDNVRRCFRFLRAIPYQTAEDRARLRDLELILVTESTMIVGV
jgi:hypothetical protein